MATRGWGRDEFDYATGEFRAAVRFALFAERTASLLAEAERVTAMRGTPLDAALARSQIASREAADQIRAVLFPEDDDE